MTVQVTLTFASQEEAIAALGRIAGIYTTPAALVQPPTAPAETKTRKPRSDAGQARGPYKQGEGDAKGAGADAPTGTPPTATSGSAPTGSVPVPPAAPAPAASTPPAPPVAPKPAAPTPDDVQKAVEKLFNAKGYDDCAQALSRFGVKRGKDLPENQRAEFIGRVDDIAAGKYAATDSWPEIT